MTDRWAVATQAKLGTLPTARLLVEAMKSAVMHNHTFTKYDGQPDAELLDLEDEVKELTQAIREKEGPKAIQGEIGDVIFSLLNVCRAQNIDFDEALESFAKRWLTRKAMQEEQVFARGFTWETLPLDVSEEIWQSVKKQLKQQEQQE